MKSEFGSTGSDGSPIRSPGWGFARGLADSRLARVVIVLTFVPALVAAGVFGWYRVTTPPHGSTPLSRSTIPIKTPQWDQGVTQAKLNGQVLAVTGSGDVYAGHSGGSPLVRYSGTGLTEIPVGSSWGSVASAPDGTVYATDYEDQVLVVIVEGRVTARVDLAPNRPTRLAVGPDGNAYVAAEHGVLEVRAGRIIRRIAVSVAWANEIAVGDDGTVAVADPDAVETIRPDGSTSRVEIEGRVGQLGVTSDGRIYVGTSLPCAVHVLERGALATSIRLGVESCTPILVTIGPDDTVYVSGYGGGRRSVSGLAVIRGSALDTIWTDVPEPLSMAVADDGAIYLATGSEVTVLR